MKKSCLFLDKKYKCVSFIVHYKGLTLKEYFICTIINKCLRCEKQCGPQPSYKYIGRGAVLQKKTINNF